MATTGRDIKDVELTEEELWADGPPHEAFKQMRSGCPIHWTDSFELFPDEPGFWSVTTADDVHTVSRDWQTYSSERGGVLVAAAGFPLELAQAMFIGMDPPKHDRLKALFQAGFTPKRIAAHEDAIRAIVVKVLDRLETPPPPPPPPGGGPPRSAAPPAPPARECCDLVSDVAQPIVARVIGSFMGIDEQDDAIWARLMNSVLGAADPDLNPDGFEGAVEKDVPEIFERCRKLIAERQDRPTDDLTSVLVHAEIDGEKLEEHEIVMGFFLLMAAGNDSTKATYCSGMRALMEQPEQLQLLLDDPALIPDAVEESLRMFPAFAHFRRTATCDTELHGQQIKEGEKVVMWYVSSNRDETRFDDADRFDIERKAEHQAFGAGGRHFCLGTALARLELKIMFEETLKRYPTIELAGEPAFVESFFINQLKTLPVRLSPA
jgi:cholest-4-en-3-one 26-monooxygenase